jgi:hypothetical protein
MATFLEMVKANGFESIKEYLDSMKGFENDAPDFTAAELEKIRENERRTDEYLSIWA